MSCQSPHHTRAAPASRTRASWDVGPAALRCEAIGAHSRSPFVCCVLLLVVQPHPNHGRAAPVQLVQPRPLFQPRGRPPPPLRLRWLQRPVPACSEVWAPAAHQCKEPQEQQLRRPAPLVASMPQDHLPPRWCLPSTALPRLLSAIAPIPTACRATATTATTAECTTTVPDTAVQEATDLPRMAQAATVATAAVWAWEAVW